MHAVKFMTSIMCARWCYVVWWNRFACYTSHTLKWGDLELLSRFYERKNARNAIHNNWEHSTVQFTQLVLLLYINVLLWLLLLLLKRFDIKLPRQSRTLKREKEFSGTVKKMCSEVIALTQKRSSSSSWDGSF